MTLGQTGCRTRQKNVNICSTNQPKLDRGEKAWTYWSDMKNWLKTRRYSAFTGLFESVSLISLCSWAAHPLLLAPSTALWMADLLDFGVSLASKSLAIDRFSVDLFFAASHSKTQRMSANSTQDTNYGIFLGPWAKLTAWDAHDGVFDRVSAGHSLLKALGPLLQEPLSCRHLQLPANTTVTPEWMQQPSSVCLNMTN